MNEFDQAFAELSDDFCPPDAHVGEASELFTAYSMHIPLDSWSTTDLVRLNELIDVELQQRAAVLSSWEERF